MVFFLACFLVDFQEEGWFFGHCDQMDSARVFCDAAHVSLLFRLLQESEAKMEKRKKAVKKIETRTTTRVRKRMTMRLRKRKNSQKTTRTKKKKTKEELVAKWMTTMVARSEVEEAERNLESTR